MRCSLITALLLAGTVLSARAALDDFYYTYDEIHHELDSLAAAHPTIMRVDSIGYSYETQTPIWSVKLSQNVNQELDKPAIWVNGQCHAEEILGINISMAFIRELAHFGDLGHPNYTPLLQAMEIHVVPSINPDGLGIVMSEQDVTFRKNLHNFNPFAGCQITPGVGNDSCGVDLNRNYPAWHNHGDDLWVQDNDVEQFDYYRGPYPLSEPECAAVANQAERERFVATVSYHSARTSTNHEIIIHSWEFIEGQKRCPERDYTMMQALTRGMADQISGQEYETYRNIAGSTRAGNHPNYVYREFGTVGLLIEVGLRLDAGMQPQNQQTIDFIVDENLDGLYWLCRRVIGYQQDAPGLRLKTREQGTNTPLEARVRIEEVMSAEHLDYYRTDPTWGALYRLLQPAAYTITTRKHGYATDTRTVNVAPTAPTTVIVPLVPLPRHTLDLSFFSNTGQSLIIDELELHDLDSDTLLVFHNQSDFELELPAGNWRMVARNVYHISHVSEFSLGGPLELSPVLYTNFETGQGQVNSWLLELDQFSQQGTNCGWVEEQLDPEHLAFSDSPTLFSPNNMDCVLLSAESFELPAVVSRERTAGVLEFDALHILEGGQDSAFVEIHSQLNGITRVLSFTGRDDQWKRHTIDLTPWAGDVIQVGFRSRTDESITDEGLFVKGVYIGWNPAATSVDPGIGQPRDFALGVYPNPFNPSTTVDLQLPLEAEGGSLRAGLYDLRGARVREVARLDGLSGSRFSTTVDGSALASGVYLLQVQVEKGGRPLYDETRRITLLK